jgi:hypothetical protein
MCISDRQNSSLRDENIQPGLFDRDCFWGMTKNFPIVYGLKSLTVLAGYSLPVNETFNNQLEIKTVNRSYGSSSNTPRRIKVIACEADPARPGCVDFRACTCDRNSKVLASSR